MNNLMIHICSIHEYFKDVLFDTDPIRTGRGVRPDIPTRAEKTTTTNKPKIPGLGRPVN